MDFLPGKCRRCGGSIYRDSDDSRRCFSCARELDIDGYPLAPKVGGKPPRYERKDHLPKWLRREFS